MTTDMTAPATKQDLANLAQVTKQDLANLAQVTKQDLADHARITKQNLADHAAIAKQDLANLEGKMESMEKRILLHFDFTAERFRSDLDMINTEVIQRHSAEILQLQIHTGLRKV